MRSEPSALRASPRGLRFSETPPRPLCVSFQPDGIAAAAAFGAPTRLHDLPAPVPPEPIVMRVRIE